MTIECCNQTGMAWATGDLVYYVAISALVFFILGLLLGRRWKGPAQGGQRPAFRNRPFQGGGAAAVRRDGPAEIYVGNMSLEMTREDVAQEFGKFGKVQNIRLIVKHGEKKAFGFVDMPVPAEAEAAIRALHGKDVKGSVMEVNIAKSPRGQRHMRRRR